MTFRFSKKSLERLVTCDIRLQQIAKKALGYGVKDFSITCGYRSPEDQLKAFKAGNSQIDGIKKKGMHNYMPSKAFDFAPYPLDWNDEQAFKEVAHLIIRAANEMGIRIVWGGSWKTFRDLPHIQIDE